jgi:acetolactate synthase-1/2/3 large subunit
VKLTDYVIEYLVSKGSTHVFGMSGGAAVHLFDSASKHPAMGTTFVVHEQSAAMAADGYFRVSGNLGGCIVTSGPGATNLLTGVCCSYYDSVPSLLLTGQVATHRLKGDRPVRQVGFQETNVLSIFSSVTKFAYQVLDADKIAWALDTAYGKAESGRPGPVLLDIPDDLQRAEVDADRLKRAAPQSRSIPHGIEESAARLIRRIEAAKRPVIILGGGLSTPRAVAPLREFLRTLQIPILQTWAGVDLIPYDWTYRFGTFGVYGPRLGNFIVQNADLVVCLGTRLSQNLTGALLDKFAPGAHLVMVDADQGEMDKFDGRGISIAERLCYRLDDLLDAAIVAAKTFRHPDFSGWLATIGRWAQVLPTDVPEVPDDSRAIVDAFHFVTELSKHLSNEEIVFVDTGGNLTWTCNNIRVKAEQRVISAWNFTPMGYALPAAIGGAAASSGRPITVIIGDGGLQLCLGELATVAHHNLPLKIFLFNNHSHGIQKQTLETWLDGRYVGVDPASGLGFSDFPRVARAMDFPVITINRSSDVARQLREVYAISGPVFCNVEINPDQKLYPVLKSGAPLQDQLPRLPESTLRALREQEAPPSRNDDAA